MMEFLITLLQATISLLWIIACVLLVWLALAVGGAIHEGIKGRRWR